MTGFVFMLAAILIGILAVVYRAEINRLKDKCDKQAMILQRLNPENYPGIFFICGEGGDKDASGLPERIHVCPGYGCGWSETYTRTLREPSTNAVGGEL